MLSELVIAHMATFAPRKANAKEVRRAIGPQVDRFWVWDNSERAMDLGDAGKFVWHDVRGYHICVDDDLFYPSDYVEVLVYWINKLGTPVSFHGRELDLDNHPWSSYFRTAAKNKYQCLGAVKDVAQIHVPGTGVFGYHTDMIRFDIQDFPNGFMADVWAAKKMHESGVLCHVAPHAEGWIKHQPIDHGTTLWALYQGKDDVQTRVLNEAFSRHNVGK